MNSIIRGLALVVCTLLTTTALTNNANATTPAIEHRDVTISNSMHFEEQGGEALFKSVCQGCHMADASGAKGAAQYPALANDPKLAGAPYPIYMVLKGQGAMPGFADVMSDQQVADVVNYVRSHFGNVYSDKVAEQDIKNIR